MFLAVAVWLSMTSHAIEVFNEDFTITDAVIQANAYEQAVFRGNLNIDCTVIGQQSFKNTIILGNVTINATIISQEAFKNAAIKGKLTINDDATIDETAFVNEIADKIIYGSLTIDEKAINSEMFEGYIILGDVTIRKASLLNERNFLNVKITGNLTINRSAMGGASFSGATVIGNVIIDRALVSQRSFYGAKISGNLEVKRTLAYKNAFDEIKVDGTEHFDESTQFFNTDSGFASRMGTIKDISYTDTILLTTDDGVFLGNIEIDNSIVEDYAFYYATILGDIIMKNSVAHPNSFPKLAGEIIADEASILTKNLPAEPSHTGEQFEGDVVITDPAVFYEQYWGATFLGDLNIESRFIDKSAFHHIIVLGNLTIRSEKISIGAFINGVVGGKLIIEEPTQLIGKAAFYGMMPTTKSLSLPPSLIEIGDQAFMNNGFTDLDIMGCSNLKKIGSQAFYGSNLSSLIFPVTDNTLTIGNEAFWAPENTGARNVYLPHHQKNLRYGYPVGEPEYSQGPPGRIIIEDFMSANDNIYLWLDSNNMETCLPIVYGNWQIFELQSCSRYDTYESCYYSLPPGSSTFGTGTLYIPKGTKQLLRQYLNAKIEQWSDPSNRHCPLLEFYPFYLYIPEDRWIEIDMYEYPYCSLNPYPGGVEQVGAGASDAMEVARYDISGRLLDKPVQGINIVRFSDGTVKKEFVK